MNIGSATSLAADACTAAPGTGRIAHKQRNGEAVHSEYLGRESSSE
jgi:hypothetical protein